MPYNETLAARVRNSFPEAVDVREMKMFGGLAFLNRGNMAVGILGDRLMVRVPRDRYEETLKERHVTPMDFTGRPMRGFVCVEGDGIAADEDLRRWVEGGLDYAGSLPAK